MLRFLLSTLVTLALIAGITPLRAQQVPLNDTPPALTIPSLPPLPKPGAPSASAPAPESKPAPAPAPAVPPKPATPPPAAPAANSSTTADGQFKIHGADLATRSWFSTQCEDVAGEVRRLLRDPAPWSIPIVLSLRTAPNISVADPAVQTSVREISSGGFHLQITVQMRPDFNSNDLRTELIRCLIAERILRDHAQITTSRRPVLPAWLLTGTIEALRYRDRARPSALFAAVFKTGKVYGIEEILGAAPTSLDALSRTIYETSCCALVLALLDQPEGNLRMSKFLNALASDPRSDREVINQWFPGFAQSKNSLDKWWSLQMAHLSRPSVFETLDPKETAKALELALAFHYETDAPVNEPVAKSKPKDSDDEPKTETVEERRSLFSRLFSGSSKDKSDDEKPKAEPPKPAKKKAEAEQSKEDDTKEVGVLSRLFGGGKDEKKDDKAKEEAQRKRDAEKKAEADAEAKRKADEARKKEEARKKAEAEAAEKKAARDKAKANEPQQPGLLRRLFSGTKDKDEKKDEKPEPKKAAPKKEEPEEKKSDDDKKKESASLAPLFYRIAADLAMPHALALADAREFLSTPSHPVVITLFKKKDEKTLAEEAKAKADKKAADEKRREEERQKEEAEKAAKKEAREKADAERKAKKDAAKKAKEDESKKPEPKKEESKKDEPKKTEAKKEEPKPASAASKPKTRKVIASIPLEEYAKVLKRPDGKSIMGATVADLSALKQRAHPLFIPVINDFVNLVADMGTASAKDIDARLKVLRAQAAAALKQATAVEDYVNWYEASQNKKWSGAFDDYLRLPETIRNELPKRNDPISRLLDEVEAKGR